MKKTWAALLALCLLAATLVALAEEPVVVDDDVEIVFGLADYDEGWEAATGEPPQENAGFCQRYYLRLRHADGATDDALEPFTERLRRWHLETPGGQVYEFQSARAEETGGGAPEVGAFFALENEWSHGRLGVKSLTLKVDGKETTYALRQVPRSAEAATLAPAEATPEELARLKEIYSQVDRWIGNAPEEDAVPEGKLAFVVYSDDGSDEPVTSYCHGILFGEVPAERLAASLDEADAVVVLWPEYEHAGSYGIGNGYRCFTKIGVYDVKAGDVLYARTALVDEPPGKVYDNENHYGRFDPYEVVRQIGRRLAAQ